MFFVQKCDEELVGRAGGQTGGRTGGQKLLHVYLRYLFSSYKLPKTVTVTTLLLLLHVTLHCGIFLCIKLSEGPVLLIDHPIDTPPIRVAGLSVYTGLVL